jgi:hypothetical protein
LSVMVGMLFFIILLSAIVKCILGKISHGN